ncbi:hypothetical protein Back11_50090 [Paenibacillus baekrokdamisoli]|uniref:Uncharacterized protein n=1 Tax=Paenibacillus baekrokdamisoli TaxID=1712516 RepID=A0A3G9JL87_9BACL|nr:hypothetical protein Back11_50090 [Paenibacillus baekrokdamisoli]
MRHSVYLCCQNPECSNDEVLFVCSALNEESSDDTANYYNFNSQKICHACKEKIIYFSAPENRNSPLFKE